MNTKSIIATSAMILSFASIAMADPFSDVPASHWAYEAVNSMAEKGIIQGFPDGTFKGNANVTRYQMAMMTAQALANVGDKGTKLSSDDTNNLEKLTVEFADELSLLGVKVISLEDNMQVLKNDVSNIKNDVDYIKSNFKNGKLQKIKLSGDFLIRNYGVDMKDFGSIHRTGSQLRLQMDAQIDENVKAVARWRMIEDKNNDFGAARMPGAAWNGANHATAEVDVAYLEIKDMFRFHGDFIFGRRFMTHGHGFIMNNYADAISYIKRCGDIDLAVNTIFERQGNIDTHPLFNINADTKYRGHDLYLGLYYGSMNKGILNDIVTEINNMTGDNLPFFDKNVKEFIIEAGAKDDLGNNGYWSYDLGGIYIKAKDWMIDSNNRRTKDGDGHVLHGAINWDSKEEWSAKVAYTSVDDEIAAPELSYDERYIDSFENPLEDIMRDRRYTAGFENDVSNIQDFKIQFEYIPRNKNKHYLRVAYDLVKPKEDNVESTFFDGVAGNVDKADVLNVEYRYRLAENTRFRAGYTNFKYGSGNLPQGLSDYNIFWTEILTRF